MATKTPDLIVDNTSTPNFLFAALTPEGEEFLGDRFGRCAGVAPLSVSVLESGAHDHMAAMIRSGLEVHSGKAPAHALPEA